MPAVSDALAQHVEAPYPPLRAEALPKAQAIVVLGGAMDPPSPGYPYPNLRAEADRVWHAARVFKAGKAPLLVASGGSDPAVTPESEAAAIAGMLVDLGVPRGAILEEGRSRNTRENAEFTAQLLAPRKVHTILLVTSALHMRRAVAEFERAGFQVIPAATDHTQPEAAGLQNWLPKADALDASGRAMKEIVGEWVVRVRGAGAAGRLAVESRARLAVGLRHLPEDLGRRFEHQPPGLDQGLQAQQRGLDGGIVPRGGAPGAPGDLDPHEHLAPRRVAPHGLADVRLQHLAPGRQEHG